MNTVLVLLVGCGLDVAPQDWPVRRGPPSQDSDPQDSDPQDSAPQDSDPQDSDPAQPGEVCFPGPKMDGTVCLSLVPYDSAWGADYAYPEPLNGSAQYSKPLYFVDLKSVSDSALALAPNFVLDEFMQEHKGRYALYQPHLVWTLQALRDELGPLTVNSGYRSVSYNAGVGGATWSRHMYGDAVDLKPNSVSLDALGQACDDLGADYVGYYEAHVHCDWRNSPLETAFYEPAPVRPGATTPTPEHSSLLEHQGALWTAPAEGWDEGEPLREWSAYSASGELLSQQTGRSFEPPLGTAKVQVVVGRALTLEQEL